MTTETATPAADIGLPKKSGFRDLPEDVQELLKQMTRNEFDLLGCEARGQAHYDRMNSFPADAEVAAKGALTALRGAAQIVRDEPLGDFMALWDVIKMALVHGTLADLGERDCNALHRLAEIADEMLTQHYAAVEEAGSRLRASVCPPPKVGVWADE